MSTKGRMAAPQQHYDLRTRRLHWGTAVLVLLMWGGAHTIDWFPKGPLRVDVRSLHIVTGALLVGLTAYRLYWRRTRGRVFARTGGWRDRAATMLHVLLYASLAVTLLLGIANASVRGDSIFGIAKLPAFGSYDSAQRHLLSGQLTDWHELSANLILVLALAHALAALAHHFLLRDNVLDRMLRGHTIEG